MPNRKNVFNFNEHLQNNFWIYIISLLCIFTGVVLGIYAVKYMGTIENESISNYLSNFAQNITDGNFQYKVMFSGILKNNLPLIIAIWFLGLTMVGLPIILIIDVMKGFTLGFALSFLIKAFGPKGISIALLGLLPQNIVYVACILFSSVIAMEFSLSFLKDKISNKWTTSIWMKLVSYSFVFGAIFVVMCFGFLFETYVTPNLVKFIMA